MKLGVEAGDLRQPRPVPRHCPDALDVVRLVQRRQAAERLQLVQHRVVHAHRL
jgi:hypothetical protein